MGIYSDTLKRREQNNAILYDLGSRNLYDEHDISKKFEYDSLIEAQVVLHDILKRFNIDNLELIEESKSITNLLDCVLDPLYIMYEEVELTDEILRQRTDYILAFSEEGHAYMLSPAVIGYRYRCPITGEHGVIKTNTKFAKTAYIIYRPLTQYKYPILSIIGLALSLISARDIIPLVASTWLITVTAMAVPKINNYVLGSIIFQGDIGIAIQLLGFYAILFISVGMLRGAMQVNKSLFLSRTRLRLSAQIQTSVMAWVLLQPSAFFYKSSSGKLSVKIKNSRVLADAIVDRLFDAGLTVVFSVKIVFQMDSYAPGLLKAAIAMIIVQSVISVITAFVTIKNEEALLEAETDANNFTFQCMKGIQKIKDIGAENRVFYLWSKMYKRIIKHTLNKPRLFMLADPIASFVSVITTSLILCLAIYEGVDYADYVAFTSAFGLVSGAVAGFVGACTSILTLKPKFEQVKSLLQRYEKESGVKQYVSTLKGSIHIDGVSYGYDENSEKCLENITIHIRKGEKIALVGKSGCGKSTLMKMLLGLVKPDEGVISYDGIPLGQLHLKSLRSHIGSVLQFSMVIPGTIAENVTFSKGSATNEEIWKACEDAAIADDIRALPLGLETEITDANSGGFSGGQKQRILIARAFLSKPSVMILDEATSALDNITQAKVLQSVYAMESTVIMVAHRLSTVKNCDRIIVLKDGHIEEQGKYEELLEKGGYFSELVAMQQL